MRRMLLIACLVVLSAQPVRAETGWLAASWQCTKSRTANACDRVCSFTSEQGQKLSAASVRDAMGATVRRGLHARGMPAELRVIDSIKAGPRPTAGRADPWAGLRPGIFQRSSALLEKLGRQAARVEYPNDQSIAESGKLLARELAELRASHPGMRLELVTHSMRRTGARSYVEGPDYAGNVDRLILLAPPNHGSTYSRWTCCSEIAEHYMLWQNHPRWHWSWPFIDGIGEAGYDLQANSLFLTNLNAHPHREGIRYTIVAGNRSCGWRYAATGVRLVGYCVPDFDTAADEAVRDSFAQWAVALNEHPCSHDGLVAIDSAIARRG